MLEQIFNRVINLEHGKYEEPSNIIYYLANISY